MEPFVTAVIERNIFQYDGVLWVEMSRTIKVSSLEGGSDVATASYSKRFFPDHFTQALLYRLLDEGMIPATVAETKPWNLLLPYLKQLSGLAPSAQPQSLDQFLKVSLSRNLLLPGSMLSFAIGQTKATCLAIGPWLRCLSGRAIRVYKPAPPVERIRVSAPKLNMHFQFSPKRQEALFSTLMQSLKPKGKTLSQHEGRRILEQFIETRTSTK